MRNQDVITVIAETSHYWFGHTTLAQRRSIGELFLAMEEESPLLQPAYADGDFSSFSSSDLRRDFCRSRLAGCGLGLLGFFGLPPSV